MKKCVGLFGTCGDSEWRKPFIKKFDELGIEYFNPQLPPGTWTEECAFVEAEHLAEDAVILFPVTSETYATGSLAEVGFSILNAIKLDDRREFVILIDKALDPALSDAVARKESLRARALVIEHLKKLRLANLYLVDDMDEMLEVSTKLWDGIVARYELLKYNPHNK